MEPSEASAPPPTSMVRRKSNFELALLAKTDDPTGESVPSMSLEDIWKSKTLFATLKTFAAKKFAEENILFLEEVLKMKDANDVKMVQPIFMEYIEASSPMEVNINSQTRKEIITKVSSKSFDINVFDTAIDELVVLIKESILQEFLAEYSTNISTPRVLPSRKKKVVIIGGGFLGLTTARLLDSMPRFEVILIDTKEYFEYTPSMIYTLVDPTCAPKWRRPYTEVVKNGQLVVNPVDSVGKDYVVAGGQKIPYHYMVVATGSSYTAQFKGFSISTSYRSKKLALEYQSLEAAKSVLVIGGGPVGIEVSTMIAYKFPTKKVVLVEANSTLLKRTNRKAQKLAMDACHKFNIEVLLNERVVVFDVANGTFKTATGKELHFDKVIIATGPVPNTDFLASVIPGSINARKELQVSETLQVKDQTNIFSGGDCCDLAVEKLAYNSAVHGVTIARNICRLEKDKEPAMMGTKGTLKPRRVQYVQMVTLGPEQILAMYRGGLTTLSPTLAKYKQATSLRTQDMLIGKADFWSHFGRLPKKLGEQRD